MVFMLSLHMPCCRQRQHWRGYSALLRLQSPDFLPHIALRMQIKFFAVSEEELEQQRVAFATGQLQLDIAEEEFDMGAYNKFLADVAPEAETLKQQQQAASAKQVTLCR